MTPSAVFIKAPDGAQLKIEVRASAVHADGRPITREFARRVVRKQSAKAKRMHRWLMAQGLSQAQALDVANRWASAALGETLDGVERHEGVA